MDKNLITTLTFARTGSNYFCEFIYNNLTNINVNFELFNNKYCCIKNNEIFQQITSLYGGSDNLCEKVKHDPYKLITDIQNLSTEKNVFFKLFLDHLNVEHTENILSKSSFIILLKRNYLDAFISNQKAKKINKYSIASTTNIQIEFDFKKYENNTKYITTLYEKYKSFIIQNKIPFIIIDYDDFHILNFSEQKIYIKKIFDKYLPNNDIYIKENSGSIKFIKQDLSHFYKDKIINYPEFVDYYYHSKKYLIIYAMGGINDILCCILKWLTYCIEFNRLLIINNSVKWFLEPIQKYISFRHPNIYNGNYNEIIDELNKSDSIFPNNCKNNLYNINVKWKSRGVYSYNDEPLLIDINKNYDEDILVCSNTMIFNKKYNILFDSCFFNPIITNVYFERLQKLPKDYISIHIRNTDHISDIDTFISQHDTILKTNPFFIASDNKQTIDFFINKYSSETVYTFSNIPDFGGARIHNKENYSEELIIDAFVDILLLASGKELYFSCEKSGYSKISNFLFKNKDILTKITSRYCP